MKMGDLQWWIVALQTIEDVVKQEFPKTRPNGPDPELRANLIWQARELGATAETLRDVLRASDEYKANQASNNGGGDVPGNGSGGSVELLVPRTPIAFPLVSSTRGWKDGHGVRPILGASWFPSLRILRDDPGRFYRQLDWFAARGVNMIRSFAGVCHPGYWKGREVMPVRAARVGDAWPDYDALVITQAKAFEERGIAWFLTAGDLQEFDSESDVYARAFRAVSPLLHVIGMVDVNEGWQNSRVKDDDPRHFESLVRPFARAGIPWATSAHSPVGNGHGDEREHIDAMWTPVGAPVATIHGPGGTDLMVRHIINHRHEHEGVGFRVGLIQGEPRGPGQDVSAGRVDSVSWVVLAATAACMTGQAYVLHTSRGVRDRDNDDPWDAFSPYFERAAKVVDRIPKARVIASQHGGRGGSGEAVFVSTRSDGAFYGDQAGVSGEFHRCDATLYDNGERGCLLFGGVGARRAKAYRSVEGVFINTHGDVIKEVSVPRGGIVEFSADEAGDGVLFVGR